MHSLILTLNGAAGTWWRFVFHALWQSSLVAVVAMIVLRIGKRWAAPLRAAVILVVFFKFLIPPMLPSPVSVFPAADKLAISINQQPVTVDSPVAETSFAVPAPSIFPEHTADFAPTPPPVPHLSLLAWLMLIHAAGSLAVLLAVAISLIRLRRLARRATELSDGPIHARMLAVADRLNIRPPRTLLLSSDPVPPMAFGVLSQTVMLPQTAVETLAPEKLDAVLAHELAHHCRRDALATVIQLAALVVWWFNPLAWLLSRELRRTREECCDDIVLSRGISRGDDYCRTILAAAENLAAPFPFRGALAMAEPMHPLGSRMKRIMDPTLRRFSRLSRAALAGVLILAAIILPGTRSRAQQQTPDAVQQPVTGDLPSLRMTVTSAADGKPIAGATLHFPMLRNFHADSHTDAQGSVIVHSLAAGLCRVEATAPDKAKVVKEITLAGGEGSLDLALPEGGSVSGKVTDKDGNPIVDVGVNSYVGNDGNPTDYYRIVADGVYRIDHLPLDQPLRLLFARTDTFVNSWQDIKLTAAQRHATLNVTLQPPLPGGSVAGTVVDADGKPIAGAQITYDGQGSRPAKPAASDAAGAFRIDDIPASRFPREIIARAAGWAPTAVPMGPLSTKDAPGHVTVQMTEKAHHMSGRVVDESGAPIKAVRVSGGTVRRTTVDQRTDRTTTGADGRFSFDSLPAPASFDFAAQGFVNIQFKQLPVDGADDVKVVMQRQGAIAGKVVDADTGQPLPAFNLKILGNGAINDRGTEFSSSTGQFRIERMNTTAKVTVVASAPGYPVQYFDGVAATPGGIGEQTVFHLSKNPPGQVRIAGRIVDSAGKPIAGLEVHALAYMHLPDDRFYEYRFSWNELRNGTLSYQRYIRVIQDARTDADGAFAFANVPGPEIDLAYWGDAVPQKRLQDIGKQPAEDREHLHIRVPVPATISGRINPQVYPDVSQLTLVSATYQGFDLSVKVESGENHYLITPLPPGGYNLAIYGKPVSNADGTFQFTPMGSEYVHVTEGESRQFDLGFDNAEAPATQPKP